MCGGFDWFYFGCYGCICFGLKKILGIFGELYFKVLQEMDIKGLVVVFVIYFEEILLLKNILVSCLVLNVLEFQVVECDFVFVVDVLVEVLILVNVVVGVDKVLIEEVCVFDEFIGGLLGEGKKLLVIIVWF